MALRRRKPERSDPPSLTETVQQVADCSCDEHRRAFLDALSVTDQLIFKVARSNIPLPDGEQHQIGDGEQILLQQVKAKDLSLLLAFPDLDAAHRHEPNATFVGIGRDEAFRMALGNPALDGILVATASDNDAWAGALRSDLISMIE